MAVSNIPRKQKKERAARPVDQDVRYAIEKGDSDALRRALSQGGRLPPSSSRQHPLFSCLADLRQAGHENPDTLPLIEQLLDRGLPAQWRVSATTDDLKRLPKPASHAFSRTLPPHPSASRHNHRLDIGASLVERLAMAGQWSAALAVVERLPEQALWADTPSSRPAMFPLQGLLAAGAWPVAARLFERIMAQVPASSLDVRFWRGLEEPMCRHAAVDNPTAQSLFAAIAQARVQHLSDQQRQELMERRHVRILPELDPRCLDRYLSWFPEEMDAWRHLSTQGAAQPLWECFLTRACIVGPGDALWERVWSDPALFAQLNRPVGGLPLDYRGRFRSRLPHVSDANRAPPLPLSPLDVMVLRVDRQHYLRDEYRASLDEDSQESSTRRRRDRHWQASVDALLEMGARPGFMRAEGGFRWTYAELWARRAHELSYSRPPTTFWRSHHWMSAPNPRTGRSPFHEAQGTQDQWQYWCQSGFDPAQRDLRGHCAFAWPLRLQLGKNTNEVRDFAKQVAHYLERNPGLWEDADGHGLSLSDVACAHPVLWRALKASGHQPGPFAQYVAIEAARPKIVDELRQGYPHTGQCPGNWTLAGIAAARLGRLGSDDTRLFPMTDLLQRLSPSGDLDGPYPPGTFLREALLRHRERWLGIWSRASEPLDWGDPAQWRPVHLFRLMSQWSHARSRMRGLPQDMAQRTLDVLLNPASWLALEDLSPRAHPDNFVKLAQELMGTAPHTAKLWDQWSHAYAALSGPEQKALDAQAAKTGFADLLSALEQSATMDRATAPAMGRSRGASRL